MLFSGCGAEERVALADGSSVSRDEWQGRWQLINYWAEWCAPCRKEIPELNRLNAEGTALGLVVIGVNYDGIGGEQLARLVEEMGIDFPVLVEDPRSRWGQDAPAVLPSTFVIDPEGQLRQVLVGPQTYESLSRAVEATVSL
jgi:thiol-disulfide isomerase/thioredoxin